MPVLTGARGAPRHRAAACWRLVGVALLLAVAGCTAERPQPAGASRRVGGGGRDDPSTAAPIAPRLLAGAPLTGRTGLELLVSGNPPRLLDLDAGTSRTVAGVPGGRDRVAWVQPVGRDAVIVSQACLGRRPGVPAAAGRSHGDAGGPRHRRRRVPRRPRPVAVAPARRAALQPTRGRARRPPAPAGRPSRLRYPAGRRHRPRPAGPDRGPTPRRAADRARRLGRRPQAGQLPGRPRRGR